MHNNIYVYDNNFVSLLSLIEFLINNKIKPLNIKDIYYNPNLFDNLIHLKLDNNINNLIKILGNLNFKIIYYVYLSNHDNKELIIYYYVLNTLKYRNNVINMRNLNCVNMALKIFNYVKRENHKFKGFTRFKELKNKVLYAEINPENNILELLSYHFKERLKNEYWIIKDVNRNLISFYNKNEFEIFNSDNINILDIELSEDEEFIKTLWKNFYNTIGIKERANNRCRMNFMPKKYWKYIVEVSEYEKNS